MHHQLQEDDFGFIKQAIRDRAELMIRQICAPVDMFAELEDKDIPVIKLEMPTSSVKKAVVVRDPIAPYGYKKDGTPKGRPGRPAKRSKFKRN